jgi:multiple sugar transport system substrate-binding protein
MRNTSGGQVDRVLTRRSILGLAGAGLAGIGLAGSAACDNTPKSGSAKTTTTIRMAWWGSTDRHRRTQEALEAFGKRRPDIKVNTQFSGWNGYWDKLATQMAGGNPPDVIQMDTSYIGEYARRGSVRVLDELVPAVLDLTDFSADVLAGGKVDNKLYGVNAGINSMSLVANLTMLKQSGIELPDHTMTWADFAELTKRLARKAPAGVFGSEYAAYDSAALECWLRQRGKALFAAEGAVGFAPSDLSDWLAYWEDLRKTRAAAAADVQATAAGDVQNSLVARRKAVFDFAHSNQLTAYSGLLNDEIVLHMYPQGPAGSMPGQYLKASQLMSISAKTEHPKEAAALIGALLTDSQIAAILGSERGIPPSTKVRAALKPQADAVERPTYEYIDFVADKVGPIPPPGPQGGGEVIGKVLTFAAQQVAFGKASIDQAVARFFEDAAKALKQ